jgi:hypothetical protein
VPKQIHIKIWQACLEDEDDDDVPPDKKTFFEFNSIEKTQKIRKNEINVLPSQLQKAPSQF